MSRTRVSPELAKKLHDICNKWGSSFVEEEYVKDASGEGYKRYFSIFDRGFPGNKEYIEKLYKVFKEEGVVLPNEY